MYSCTREEINITCADPLGSDIQIQNDSSITCLQEGLNGCLRFELTANPPSIQSIYFTGHTYGAIQDAGELNCLSEVTMKPTEDWHYRVPLILHHGYVMQMADSSYGRIFIHSIDMNGGAMAQITITRQYAY